MRIVIATPTPDTIYESNLQKYDEEQVNRQTRVLFRTTVNIQYADKSMSTENVNDKPYETMTTA